MKEAEQLDCSRSHGEVQAFPTENFCFLSNSTKEKPYHHLFLGVVSKPA